VDLEPAERVGPGEEAERRGAEAEEEDGGAGLGAGVRDRDGCRGRERHERERADPHRPGGHAQRPVPRQQRLLEHEERRLGDGGREHEQRVGRDGEAAALADRDDRRAGEADRHAGPCGGVEPLAQEGRRHHGDEHGPGRDEERRRPGIDGLLARVEQQLATSYDFAVACALAAAGHGVALVPQLALDPLPALAAPPPSA
jgi:hypothetical protein